MSLSTQIIAESVLSARAFISSSVELKAAVDKKSQRPESSLIIVTDFTFSEGFKVSGSIMWQYLTPSRSKYLW